MKNFLRTPFYFHSLPLPSNVFYAPLAGCSDYPYRTMSARYQPGLQFCEMVKMDPLVRREPATMRLLHYCESMRPIGAQICGSKVELAAEAARIVQDLGFDVIDLNCGCPVDKVTKDGSGSGLLKDIGKIGAIVKQMKRAVSIPITVKIRAGWDENSIVAPQVAAIVEDAGATAMTVHGRTREQGYRGEAIREWIAQAKYAAKSLLIIGNGDIFSFDAALKMFQETGCDGILVARGTMGQPWMAEDIYRGFKGLDPVQRGPLERIEALVEHFEAICSYFPERKAVLDMRRISSWYIKHLYNAASFRQQINQSSTLHEVRQWLQNVRDQSLFSSNLRENACSQRE